MAYLVRYKGQYKSPKFETFDKAYSYCKKQAPLIGLNNSYFEIYNDTIHYDITFKNINGEFVESYRFITKHKPAINNSNVPIILHYNGSDQDFFSGNEKNKVVDRIKEITPKMAGKCIILIHGDRMWKTSYDGKTLHHQPCKLVNGEYVNIVA